MITRKTLFTRAAVGLVGVALAGAALATSTPASAAQPAGGLPKNSTAQSYLTALPTTVTEGRYCDPYGALGVFGEDNFTLCFNVEPFGQVGSNQAFIVDSTSVTAAHYTDGETQWFRSFNGLNGTTLTTYGGAFTSDQSRGYTGPWTIGQGGYVTTCTTDNDFEAFKIWFNPNGTTTTGGSSPKWNFADVAGQGVC